MIAPNLTLALTDYLYNLCWAEWNSKIVYAGCRVLALVKIPGHLESATWNVAGENAVHFPAPVTKAVLGDIPPTMIAIIAPLQFIYFHSLNRKP